MWIKSDMANFKLLVPVSPLLLLRGPRFENHDRKNAHLWAYARPAGRALNRMRP